MVQCVPLYSILQALGNPVVDFFSLDVEGSEEGVLGSIPWDKVDIRVVLVEVEHSDKPAIKELMENNGYKMILEINNQDYLFMKENVAVQ